MARLFGTDRLAMRLRLLGAEVCASAGICAVIWAAGMVAGIDKKGS